jgi:hypothetical protein
MKSRFFMPVGGTGNGPTAMPFRQELWTYIFEKALPANSERKVALLATPSRLCDNKIDIAKLIVNYKEIEKSLKCTFHLLEERRFGQGRYDDQFDVLCVTCGDTAGAREFWKTDGCEKVIREWYRNGVVCTGYSAGFILFYDWASTDSVAGPPDTQFGIMSGMGIIKGGAIPHADTQTRRIPDFQLVLKGNKIKPVLALGEDVMAVYVNETMERLVSPLNKPQGSLVEHDRLKELKIHKI